MVRQIKWPVAIAIAMVFLSAKTIPQPAFNVVVNPTNATSNLSAADLRDVLLGNLREWPNHRRITVVQRDEKSAVVTAVLKSLLGMSLDEYHRYLLELEFRGKATIPLKIMASDEAVCEFVFNAPGSIGFIPSLAAGKPACGSQVKVLPVGGKH